LTSIWRSCFRRIVWVVDGLRRARDRAQFFASLGTAKVVKGKPLTVLFPSNQGALLRDWAANRVPVFFDFGEPVLWRLHPRSPNGRADLSPVLKTMFLHVHLEGQPLKGVDYSGTARSVLLFRQQAGPFRWATGFQKHMPGEQEARRRTRFCRGKRNVRSLAHQRNRDSSQVRLARHSRLDLLTVSTSHLTQLRHRKPPLVC
jgi:hypothetical protein